MHNPEKHLFPAEAGNPMFRWEHHLEYKTSVFYHFHSQYELNLTETPDSRRIIGDNTAGISGRDLVLIGPNLPHRWEIESKDGKEPSADFWVLVFSRESLGVELLSRPEMSAVNSFLQQAARGFTFSRKTADSVSEQIKRIDRLNGLGRVTAFFKIIDDLINDPEKKTVIGPEYESSGSEENYRLIAEIVGKFSPIENNNTADDDEAPSLKKAAAHAGMSVSTFTRFFRRMTGESFISYMIGIQIHYACSLLRSTEYSVTEISERSGFSNLSHFNRQFLKATGMQPREYRRKK
jgi:AraC-like DNA-binding protein